MPNWSSGSCLLAVGPCCPAGKHISMDNVEIVRALTCSHNCFISTVKIQQKAAVTPKASCITGSACSCHSIGPLGVAKSYRKANLDDDETKQVEAEIKVHQQLTSNPHVVPFWAALDTPDSITIITARCEGDLRGMLVQAGAALSEEAVRSQVAAPMLQVLQHMHSEGFVHRDIKPENIFISGTRAMLGDFGLAIAMPSAATSATARAEAAAVAKGSTSTSSDQSSRLAQCSGVSRASSIGGALEPKRAAQQLRSCTSSQDLSDTSTHSNNTVAQERTSSIRRSSSCGMLGFDCNTIPKLHTLHAGGTAAYTAPEVVAAAFNNTSVEDAVGPQNDVWSLAVLLLECLRGRHPFGDPTMSPGAFLCSIISKTQAQINACINALPVSDLCKDWLQQALVVDVKQRATAAQLIQHKWITRTASNTSHVSEQEGQQLGQGQAELRHVQQLQQQLPQHFSCPEPLQASAQCSAGAWDMRSLSSAALSSCLPGQGVQQAACGWETAAAAAARCDVAGTEVLPCSGSNAGNACCQQQLQAATSFSYMESIGSWED